MGCTTNEKLHLGVDENPFANFQVHQGVQDLHLALGHVTPQKKNFNFLPTHGFSELNH